MNGCVWAGLLLGAVAGVVGCWSILRRRRSGPVVDPRVAELSELAGGLAHEIRNPLSTIMLNLDLLAEELSEEPEPDDHVRRALQKIEGVRHEAERLRRLLDDFLQMAGPERAERGREDLNEVVTRTVEFFNAQAAAAKVRLRVDLHEGSLVCLLDARRIEQALLNLLLNATQAMADGGEVMVRTWRDSRRSAGLEVTDTGRGIAQEEQAMVFRPFYSTKAGGTGLGLSTTHRIVSDHGGTITMHSDPGRGTCFTIRLPLVE
ncbi:MAG: nitrogen regulation protein NR(II) [Phycisphaerae bacterium]